MKQFKYEVSKRMEIAGCHHLNLPYESKCKNLHGHNWVITVTVGADELEHDMVIDFTHIKKEVHSRLDHGNLNEIFDFNPTAENIAKWICDRINTIRRGKAICTKVVVQESEGNIATYNNLEE